MIVPLIIVLMMNVVIVVILVKKKSEDENNNENANNVNVVIIVKKKRENIVKNIVLVEKWINVKTRTKKKHHTKVKSNIREIVQKMVNVFLLQ
jgi:ABC-type phosphate/phosphonate transport system substrate-binding protein